MAEKDTKKADPDEGLEREPAGLGFGNGLARELKQTASNYIQDWKGPLWNVSTYSTAVFWLLSVYPCTLSLGQAASGETDGHIGLSEYLLAQAIAGLVHVVIGGQPLLVVRPTGVITNTIINIYKIAKWNAWDGHSADTIFRPLMFWTGVWLGAIFTVFSLVEGSRLIKYFSRYTLDLFAVFVCSTYIYDGLLVLLEGPYHDLAFKGIGWQYNLSLCAVTFGGSLLFKLQYYFEWGMYGWAAPAWVKKTLNEFDLFCAILLAMGLNLFYPEVHSVDNYHPEKPTDRETQWAAYYPTEGKVIIMSLGVALMTAPLLLLDQTASARLAQRPGLPWSRRSYHLSAFVMGLTNFGLPALGMPFATASLPQSPQVARRLTEEDRATGTFTRVVEGRVAGLVAMLGALMADFVFRDINTSVPMGVVAGILMYVGFTGFFEPRNELFERCCYFIKKACTFCLPRTMVSPSKYDVQGTAFWTFSQVALFIFTWGLNLTDAGLLANLVFMCVALPFRMYVLPKIISEDDIRVLDSPEEGLEEDAKASAPVDSQAIVLTEQSGLLTSNTLNSHSLKK